MDSQTPAMSSETCLDPDLSDMPRSLRLKAATRGSHDALDKRIMAGDIFGSRLRFARFLRVQYQFHSVVDALYASDELTTVLPDLDGRRRLQKIAQDLSDLGQPLPPVPAISPLVGAPLPTALGWLYVAEGSHLGGAVLFKMAARLGLDAGFGARHLAAHPDGVARHWRQFTSALDTQALMPEQERQVIEAADEAFRSVHRYVEDAFA